MKVIGYQLFRLGINYTKNTSNLTKRYGRYGSRWTGRQQNYKIMDGRKDADNTKIISLGLYQTEYNVDTDHMTRN